MHCSSVSYNWSIGHKSWVHATISMLRMWGHKSQIDLYEVRHYRALNTLIPYGCSVRINQTYQEICLSLLHNFRLLNCHSIYYNSQNSYMQTHTFIITDSSPVNQSTLCQWWFRVISCVSFLHSRTCRFSVVIFQTRSRLACDNHLTQITLRPIVMFNSPSLTCIMCWDQRNPTIGLRALRLFWWNLFRPDWLVTVWLIAKRNDLWI